MPTQFCTGSKCCSNHRNDKPVVPSEDPIECKDFVIIGNGPSGIALSYLLSGNWPYYVGESPDEFLHARLMVEPHLSLIEQDLQFLSDGLEGRSSNPVSLLLDALQKPEADLGLELPSLLEWSSRPDKKVDHVVLGRGKPGGIWQTLNGSLLTVSLGGWMELPNLSMTNWKESQQFKEGSKEAMSRRTSVANVSKYYTDYVEIMGLIENFRDNTVVTGVKQVKCEDICGLGKISHSKEHQDKYVTNPTYQGDAAASEEEEVFNVDIDDQAPDDLSSQCSSMSRRRSLSSASMDSCTIDPCSPMPPQSLPSTSSQRCRPEHQHNCDNDISFSCDFSQSLEQRCDESLLNWDPILNPSLFSCSYRQTPNLIGRAASIQDYSRSLSSESYKIRSRQYMEKLCTQETLFEVTGYEVIANHAGAKEMKEFKYVAKNVVLATGQTDEPNRLEVTGEDLPFVLHNLKDLDELVTTHRLTPHSDPVLIVGAGLSAADAIIHSQGLGLSVAHVFRKAVTDPGLIFNKLPVALYPEYHRVHKMMASSSSKYSGYQAWAQTEIQKITKDRRVYLRRTDSDEVIKVSYILVLIGASPNLSFLAEAGQQLGRIPGAAIDRNNPIDIDPYTHRCNNIPGLYAMGPLTGDNFVRFIQGGALAIASDIHHKNTQEGRRDDADI